MLRITLTVFVLGLLVSPAGLADDWADVQKQAAQMKALRTAQLKDIAGLVARESSGKASLLLDAGSIANPRTGHWVRDAAWGELPLVEVWPVSQPVEANFGKERPGRILGAIALVTDFGSARVQNADYGGLKVLPGREEGTGKATAGVYVLFQPKGRSEIVLMSAHRAGASVTCTRALRVPMTGFKQDAPAKRARAYARFPDKAHVSDQNPAWRVDVDLMFPREAWTFRLDAIGLEFT
jgi:hypothetical protein